MPSVQRVNDQFKGQPLMILSISVDGQGLPAVQRYMAKNGFTMPALADAKMETARRFGARGVPTTFIVNRQGLIVASGYGSINFDDPAFRTYLRALLGSSQS
jgi:peroxiredoxin